MRKLVLMLALVSLASVALVACGGGDGDTTTAAQTETTSEEPAGGGGGAGGGGAASTLKLAADPSQIAYDTDSLTAKSGDVTIDFDNPNDGLAHNVCVEAEGEEDLGCSQTVTGQAATLDLKGLEPGTYTFYCSVDAHEAAGMKGTLTVQ